MLVHKVKPSNSVRLQIFRECQVTAPVPTTSEATNVAVAVTDPIAAAKALSGRKHLTPAEARRRYAAILAAFAVGGRKQSWVAEQLGFSESNMSRLLRDARRTFATEMSA